MVTKSSKITEIEAVFESDGPLNRAISGYLPRDVQKQMALAVTNALANTEKLIVEAGTGTGKTFAYVIPSLLSNKKVIISTGTKNLQDQLFQRDLPLIRRALASSSKIAILKGRSNYLCLYRLGRNAQSHFIRSDVQHSLEVIRQWSNQTKDGDLEQLGTLESTPHLLHYITSTTDNCLGQECDFFQRCFVFQARRKAQEADVLIINHHLFFADRNLKDAGINDFLPKTHAIIFDEAHQIPEVATHFLGEAISSRQLIYLARDILIEQKIEASDMVELKHLSEQLITETKGFLTAFGAKKRGLFKDIIYKIEINSASALLRTCLDDLCQILEKASVRGKGLENAWKRVVELNGRWKRLNTLSAEDQVHWFEVHEHHFSIHHTPLETGKYFQALLEGDSKKTWIFTSATISVAGNFDHFMQQIGLAQAPSLHLESPFDYQKQSLLYTPEMRIQPGEEGYTAHLVEQVVPVLQLTRGRAFLLFTSHKALREAALLLTPILNFPLFIQGNAPKSQLLQSFCASENAVLLGTGSFWEGVDVKGSQLSCVIIDKIPFASPDDPILQARMDDYRRKEKNPFTEFQLPQAIIALRQGAGRLIRDMSDRGILVLCDPRLKSKSYGRVIMKALPPMRHSSKLQDVAHFLDVVCEV